MPTPLRNIRVDDELWARAGIAAEARGNDLSTEIRAFLERLARNHERKSGWCARHGYDPCACKTGVGQ